MPDEGLCRLLSITFYLAVGLTALSFVLERKEGLLDRCCVAGEKYHFLCEEMLPSAGGNLY